MTGLYTTLPVDISYELKITDALPSQAARLLYL